MDLSRIFFKGTVCATTVDLYFLRQLYSPKLKKKIKNIFYMTKIIIFK